MNEQKAISSKPVLKISFDIHNNLFFTEYEIWQTRKIKKIHFSSKNFFQICVLSKLVEKILYKKNDISDFIIRESLFLYFI